MNDRYAPPNPVPEPPARDDDLQQSEIRESPNPWPVWLAIQQVQAAVQVVPTDDSADIVDSAGKLKYSYSFLSLPSLDAAVRPHLEAAGLILVQHTKPGPTPGTMDFRSRYVHPEAQAWVEFGLIIPMGQDPQKTGSALTYANRYARGLNLNIITTRDDDGRAASPPAAAAEDVRHVAGRVKAITDEVLHTQAVEEWKAAGLPPAQGARAQEWNVDQLAEAQKLARRFETRQAQLDRAEGMERTDPGAEHPQSSEDAGGPSDAANLALVLIDKDWKRRADDGSGVMTFDSPSRDHIAQIASDGAVSWWVPGDAAPRLTTTSTADTMAELDRIDRQTARQRLADAAREKVAAEVAAHPPAEPDQT